MKHLNPRQGITTGRRTDRAEDRVPEIGVKHLNPRQGITTYNLELEDKNVFERRVKHLNPRQGITTVVRPSQRRRHVALQCETPKSPPGDYNRDRALVGVQLG